MIEFLNISVKMKAIYLSVFFTYFLIYVTGLPQFKKNNCNDTKIVGGYNARRYQVPYQVGLLHMPDVHPVFFCGGSLIASKWVLTAAHCVDNKYKSDILVVAGDLSQMNNEGTEQYRRTQEVYIHQYWSDTGKRLGDIALIEVTSEFLINHDVNSIDVPQFFNGDASGYVSTVSGWGSLYNGGPVSDMLQIFNPVVGATNTCKFLYGEDRMCTLRDVCSEIGTCHGDSGGPLVLYSVFNYPRLYGVVKGSSSLYCALIQDVDIYTDTYYYERWIYLTMWGGEPLL